MNKKKDRNVIIGIALLILIVTTLHFSTPIHSVFYHDIYDRLYYIPVIISAFFFGIRGGGTVAALSGVIFFSHLFFQWRVHEHMDLTGRYLEIMMYMVVGILIGLLTDLERKQRRKTEVAYEQLKDSFEKAKESARLAALGTLAAGIAHEIRNPLGGIKGAMEIISDEFAPSHPKYRFVEIINKEILRMERIVGDFLGFSRPQKPVLAPDRINSVVRSVLDLCNKNLSKNHITLKTEFGEAVPSTCIDTNQVKQVLLNLILNSIDSMPEGGALEISTHQVEDGIEIRVLDSGKGIDPDEVDKLFEPFYTKKQNGTGLGLPISRQIVEQHGGSLTISNRSDSPGTVAVVRIPLNVSCEGGV